MKYHPITDSEISLVIGMMFCVLVCAMGTGLIAGMFIGVHLVPADDGSELNGWFWLIMIGLATAFFYYRVFALFRAIKKETKFADVKENPHEPGTFDYYEWENTHESW